MRRIAATSPFLASLAALSFGLIRIVDEVGVENDFAIAAIVLGGWVVLCVLALLWLASGPFDRER